MATKSPTPSPKQLTFEILDDLDSQFCNEEVLVRLLHHWEARNHKKGNILMGIELLLLDSKGTAVQAFISASRAFRYDQDLKSNTVYTMKNFMVNSSKKYYCVSDYKHAICFTDKTTFVPTALGDHIIDEQKFRLRTYEDFSAIADTNVHLFDVIGELRLIAGDNLHSKTTTETTKEVHVTKSSDRVMLHLMQIDGQTICIYLWGSIAEKFRTRWTEEGSKPKVVLITTVNPKTIGGALTLSSTSATRLFFDIDVAETKKFCTRVSESGNTPPTVASASSSITKLETVTIKELHQYLESEIPQAANFICEATIVDIVDQYGWHYFSCSSCNTKLGKSGTSMYCNKCNKTNNVGLIRYRFEITVRDVNKDTASFVVFDREGTNFAGKRASDVLNQCIEGVDESEQETQKTKIPECLKHIIGRTCKFQIKVSMYNFQTSRQTFSVSRIIKDNVGLPNVASEVPATVNADCEIILHTGNTHAQGDSDTPLSSTNKKEKRPRLDN